MTYFKLLLVTGLFLGASLLTIAAETEQCAFFSAEVQTKVEKWVRRGDTVLQFCQPCGDLSPRRIQVRNFSFNDEGILGRLKINGTTANYGFDLAYVYVLVREESLRSITSRRVESVYENLALLSGCPVKEVSAKLSVFVEDADSLTPKFETILSAVIQATN